MRFTIVILCLLISACATPPSNQEMAENILKKAPGKIIDNPDSKLSIQISDYSMAIHLNKDSEKPSSKITDDAFTAIQNIVSENVLESEDLRIAFECAPFKVAGRDWDGSLCGLSEQQRVRIAKMELDYYIRNGYNNTTLPDDPKYVSMFTDPNTGRLISKDHPKIYRVNDDGGYVLYEMAKYFKEKNEVDYFNKTVDVFLRDGGWSPVVTSEFLSLQTNPETELKIKNIKNDLDVILKEIGNSNIKCNIPQWKFLGANSFACDYPNSDLAHERKVKLPVLLNKLMNKPEYNNPFRQRALNYIISNTFGDFKYSILNEKESSSTTNIQTAQISSKRGSESSVLNQLRKIKKQSQIYAQGIKYEESKNTENARTVYHYLIDTYPNGKYTDKAIERLTQLQKNDINQNQAPVQNSSNLTVSSNSIQPHLDESCVKSCNEVAHSCKNAIPLQTTTNNLARASNTGPLSSVTEGVLTMGSQLIQQQSDIKNAEQACEAQQNMCISSCQR